MALLLFLVGCSVDKNIGSRIVIKMPENLHKASDVQSMGINSCFAISILGEPETTAATSCDPQFGLFKGLVKAGEQVEINVSQGSGRTIELYYVASSDGCREFSPSEGLAKTYGSNNVYRIAKKVGLDFNQPEIYVDIVAQIPHRSNSVAVLDAPSGGDSCKIGADPIDYLANSQARIVLGAGQGSTPNGSKMRVRILDQQIKIENPNNWSGRIVPHRLGEE
ncbi:MAG: hypothetical protein KDD33_12660 [Bdellovibrionales bacterium]|nr:hypothetical protein [Bdellovibrionales bacterium]